MSNLFIKKRNPNELLALTGIRGIAAIFVVLSHINLYFMATFNLGRIFYVQPFVDLFFVLSGFVISMVYIKSAEFTRPFFSKFFAARFARIYPLYIVALIISAVLILLSVKLAPHAPHNKEALSTSAILKQLFLVSALPYFYCKMLILTSWSVSIEWWLYILLFPLLMVLKKFREFLAKPVCIIILSLILIIYLYQPHITEVASISWPAFARGLVGFILGWLTHWHFSNNTKLSEFCKRYCDVLMIIAAITLIVLPLFIKNQAWPALVIFPFLILGLCYNTSVSTKIFSSRFFVILGDISYSVYLLHPIVLTICGMLVKKLSSLSEFALITLYVAGVFAGTLLISYVSYVFFEAPVRARIYTYLTRKKPYEYSPLLQKDSAKNGN